MNKVKILYVEDDQTLGFVTKDNLEQEGYEVVHCSTGNEALESIKKDHFDLAILDVMLPQVDGFTLAEEIRKRNREVPLLFLTAKILKEDRLKGFSLGADDYITKPFSIEELIYKVQVFLKRRTISDQESQRIYEIGIYTFQHENLALSWADQNRTLTQREADLLKYLLDHRNNVIKRGAILKTIWGEDDYFLGRSLDVFISRLRKYLKEDPTIQIQNVHGVGFKLSDS